MTKRTLSRLIIAAIVIVLAVIISLLINFTHRDVLNQVNIIPRFILATHSEVYSKYIFHVLAEEMEELPQRRPVAAKEEGTVSILHGKMDEGSSRVFHQFLNKSSDGKAAKVIIVVYTTEGDPINKNVLFDGERYFAVIEDTRERVKEESLENMKLCFDYIRIITHPETGSKFAILTNDAELTFEKLRDAQIASDMESIDAYQLFSYSD